MECIPYGMLQSSGEAVELSSRNQNGICIDSPYRSVQSPGQPWNGQCREQARIETGGENQRRGHPTPKLLPRFRLIWVALCRFKFFRHRILPHWIWQCAHVASCFCGSNQQPKHHLESRSQPAAQRSVPHRCAVG